MKKVLLMFALLLGAMGAKAEDVIQVTPFSTNAGVVSDDGENFGVELIKDEFPVSAIQFDLYLPGGMTLDETYDDADQGVYAAAVLADARTQMKVGRVYVSTNHSVSYNKLANVDGFNVYKVVIYSSTGAEVQGASGLFASFYYLTDDAMADGVYPIYMKDVIFDNGKAGDEAAAIKLAGISSYVVVGNPASSVANLPLEGYVPSFVNEALAADDAVTTLDLSNVTGMGGTLTLKDGVSLVPPTTEITVPAATYTRATTKQYGTICLPYAVKSDATVQYYTVESLAAGELNLTALDEVEAGVPAIFENLSGEGFTASVENAIIPVVDTNETDGVVKLIGTYAETKVTDANTYYIKDNKFWSINEYFYSDAYRAYLKAAEEVAAKVLSIGEGSATAIDAINALADGEYEGIYTVGGARVDRLQKGVNLIKTNDGVKKIMVK